MCGIVKVLNTPFIPRLNRFCAVQVQSVAVLSRSCTLGSGCSIGPRQESGQTRKSFVVVPSDFGSVLCAAFELALPASRSLLPVPDALLLLLLLLLPLPIVVFELLKLLQLIRLVLFFLLLPVF